MQFNRIISTICDCISMNDVSHLHHRHHHHHHYHYYYLGCADFVPSNLDPGSQFAVPMFECFDEVLRKASSWVRHQRRVRITNVQSIDYKLKHDYGTDTLRYEMLRNV